MRPVSMSIGAPQMGHSGRRWARVEAPGGRLNVQYSEKGISSGIWIASAVVLSHRVLHGHALKQDRDVVADFRALSGRDAGLPDVQEVVVVDRAARIQAHDVRAQIVVNGIGYEIAHLGRLSRLQRRLDGEQRLAGLREKSVDVEIQVGRLDLAQADGGVGQRAACGCSAPQLGQNFAPAATWVPHFGQGAVGAALAAENTAPARPMPATTAGAEPSPPLAAPSPMPSIASPAAALWKLPASFVYWTSRRYFLSVSSSSGLIEMTKLPIRATLMP